MNPVQSFITFRYPNQVARFFLNPSKSTQAVFNKNFAFVSFDNEKQYYFDVENELNQSESTFSTINFNELNIATDTEHEGNQADFEKLVNQCINEIHKKECIKIVASRIKQVSFQNFNVSVFFKRLCLQYPNAFCYVLYDHDCGFWTGASPEILLSCKNDQAETVSLAGTKSAEQITEGNEFTDKEIIEQKIVSDFIMSKLNDLNCTKIQLHESDKIKAGQLFHLYNKISFQRPTISLQSILEGLHPTPATCGMPKEIAKNFIQKNEAYARTFYTGYLGILEENECNIWVNIRCMQLFEHHAKLYIGCGITSASNATDEWQESENKSQTMLRILNL